ncbi:hypothetical protein CDEF62S_00154 [Castellaniella defragrans]
MQFINNNYQWLFSGAALAILTMVFSVFKGPKDDSPPTPVNRKINELIEGKERISQITAKAKNGIWELDGSEFEAVTEKIKKRHRILFDELTTVLGNIQRKNLLFSVYSKELVKMVTWNEFMFEIIRSRGGENWKKPQSFKRNYQNLWKWYQLAIGDIIDYSIEIPQRNKKVWNPTAEPSKKAEEIARIAVKEYLDNLKISGGSAKFEPKYKNLLMKI